MHIFNRLKSGQVPPTNAQMEEELKGELFKLVGFSPSNEHQKPLQQQEPLIAEIGQRIGNLMKFVGSINNFTKIFLSQGIGPKWLSFNLAALYLRHFGIVSEAVICLEAALKVFLIIFYLKNIFLIELKFSIQCMRTLP
jgi:hypothetical protein